MKIQLKLYIILRRQRQFYRNMLEKDTEGNPVKVAGFIQDITERRQVEEALRESRLQLIDRFAANSEGEGGRTVCDRARYLRNIPIRWKLRAPNW